MKCPSVDDLLQFNMPISDARDAVSNLARWQAQHSDVECWQRVTQQVLVPDDDFHLHQLFYDHIYSHRDSHTNPGPAWLPSEKHIQRSNLYGFMRVLDIDQYDALYQWSIKNPDKYWHMAIQAIAIEFNTPYTQVLDTSQGTEHAQWLVGSKFNVANSCFHAPKVSTAAVYLSTDGHIEEMTYEALEQLTNQVANGISNLFLPGEAIAIDMPMNIESVAIYLGILKAGCSVVSIADSFASDEIATRLRLSEAKGIFTQDVILRGDKQVPLYEKVTAANAPQAIVLPADGKTLAVNLRAGDKAWDDFLPTTPHFDAMPAEADKLINILFSSGTTGDPKAIPWSQTSAIKAAIDGYFHLDIQPGERVAWPTNLGWMMGPWLIFATLINKATLVLNPQMPTTREFARFIQKARVDILGVVPSIVKAWRQNEVLTGINWQHIKLFASTGETSNAEDMLFLMSRAGYRPVIEYCGGTEISGAYLSSTVIQPNIPSTFSTPALGTEIKLLSEEGKIMVDKGEVAIVPPAMGLSQRLLNKDHHKIYYEGMPATYDNRIMRRHGDMLEQVAKTYYRALGRSDDTMNLGGIKVSSAEIERTILTLENLQEVAAIAVSRGGPSKLVIYYVTVPDCNEPPQALQTAMQQTIKDNLNPLFKIHMLVNIDKLPRTTSNKIMRRTLRDEFLKQHQDKL